MECPRNYQMNCHKYKGTNQLTKYPRPPCIHVLVPQMVFPVLVFTLNHFLCRKQMNLSLASIVCTMIHVIQKSTSTSSNDPHKSNIPTIVSKYSALPQSSKPKATIDYACKQTPTGFLKTDGDNNNSWSYKPTSKNKGQFQVMCNF